MRGMALILLASSLAASAQTTSLERDERITFYPGIAQRVPGKDAWRIDVRGSIFEPEKRGVFLWTLREALDLKDIELTPAEEKIFNERARLFLLDHERGKRVYVRLGLKSYAVGKSQADGSFSSILTLRSDEAAAFEFASNSPPRFVFEAALPLGSDRLFQGEAFALEETGLSVISDIDDTIKVTDVRDRKATIRNTLLREFEPVPDMADFYQRLARERGAQFHYVSASPWQLYDPLAKFVADNGFPRGTFALKKFRWKDRSFLSLFADPEKYKPSVIEPLLKQFPNRRVILIGDSGERDPEIYGMLARKFPKQIERILIRNVTKEPADADRYTEAFHDVRRDFWQVFTTPQEIR
jgi:hypothetical protein